MKTKAHKIEKKKIPTFDEMMTLFQKNEEELKLNAKEFDRKLELSRAEIELSSQKFKEESIAFRKELKEISKQIGGLSNSFGEFTEDLFMNSLESLLSKKFGIQFFTPNVERKLQGNAIEIDAMGIVNGNVNAVYITEIKSRFSKNAIEQLSNIISKFDKFFPELSDKKKYGILAVPRLKEDQATQILKAGFYPATLKNDLAVIETPKSFKAKVF